MECEKTGEYYITLFVSRENRFEKTPYNLVRTHIKQGDSFSKIAKELRVAAFENQLNKICDKPSRILWAIYEKKHADENHEYFFEGAEYFSLVAQSDGLIVNDELPFDDEYEKWNKSMKAWESLEFGEDLE